MNQGIINVLKFSKQNFPIKSRHSQREARLQSAVQRIEATESCALLWRIWRLDEAANRRECWNSAIASARTQPDSRRTGRSVTAQLVRYEQRHQRSQGKFSRSGINPPGFTGFAQLEILYLHFRSVREMCICSWTRIHFGHPSSKKRTALQHQNKSTSEHLIIIPSI